MNPNRQSNCFTNRLCGRTQMPIPSNVIGSNSCNNNAVVISTGTCGNETGGNSISDGCVDKGCNKETTLNELPIAMAYVPWQSYENIYSLSQALQNGTMFCELNLDFAGRRCN